MNESFTINNIRRIRNLWKNSERKNTLMFVFRFIASIDENWIWFRFTFLIRLEKLKKQNELKDQTAQLLGHFQPVSSAQIIERTHLRHTDDVKLERRSTSVFVDLSSHIFFIWPTKTSFVSSDGTNFGHPGLCRWTDGDEISDWILLLLEKIAFSLGKFSGLIWTRRRWFVSRVAKAKMNDKRKNKIVKLTKIQIKIEEKFQRSNVKRNRRIRYIFLRVLLTGTWDDNRRWRIFTYGERKYWFCLVVQNSSINFYVENEFLFDKYDLSSSFRFVVVLSNRFDRKSTNSTDRVHPKVQR